MSSLFLSPSPLSSSLPQSTLQPSQLGYPFNSNCNNNSSRDQRGKLLLVARASESHSASTEALNFVKKNDKLPTKNKQVLVTDNEVPIKEEDPEILLYVKRSGKLQVLDFVERIKTLPAGERIEILNFFENHSGFPNLSDFNNLLIALVKADEPEFAEKLFCKLPSYGLVPDSRTFSIMIRLYCKKNDPNKAKQFLDQTVENGFSHNVATFTILINSFSKRGRLKKAFEVIKIMGQVGCEPTVETYNCLINGLCYVGRVEEASELLMKMKKSYKKPDIYSYTTVMDGFCKVGRSDEAMELLQEALEMELKPNVITFNTLFTGYCKEGRPLEGINLLQQMKDRKCWPDYISYSTLLHGLLKWDEIPAALLVYKEMLSIGFEVEERMMNTLFRGICRRYWTDKELLKDAEEVFDRMKNMGSVPYPSAYCLMVQALSMRGDTDKAFVNLQEMVRIGYPSRSITFNNVIRALCREGRIDDASLVFVLMLNRSAIPNRNSYKLLIHELNKQGRFLNASEVYGAALKRGVVPHWSQGNGKWMIAM